MAARKARGETVYGGAYMIHADNRRARKRHASTPEYQVAEVFGPLWRGREYLRPAAGETLGCYHRRLSELHGMGSFMAAQVIGTSSMLRLSKRHPTG